MNNLSTIIIFLYLAIFPLGQILRLKFLLSDYLVCLLVLLPVPFSFKKYPAIKAMLMVFFFSYIFSLLQGRSFSPTSALYLLRFLAYNLLFLKMITLIRSKLLSESVLLQALMAIGIFISVLGWVQYLFYPDLRSLAVWGWDDHLNRLVGTFLDPGFTGIIMVFAFLIYCFRAFQTKKVIYVVSSVFLAASIAFTYSRASYLALIAGFLFLCVKMKRKAFIWIILLFVLGIFTVLPRFPGEGTRLFRTASIRERLQDSLRTARIFSQNPLFGVGFNNICLVKDGSTGRKSHSCSGADNSFLFVLATTGALGFLAFVNFLLEQIRTTNNNPAGLVFFSTGVSLVVHSFFSNTFFYPFVLGWMGILAAISRIEVKGQR